MLTWYSKTELPVISWKKLIRMYKNLGFELERHGRYPFYSLDGKRGFPCPAHNNDDLDRGVLKNILLESGCYFKGGGLRMKSDEEWLEDLEKNRPTTKKFSHSRDVYYCTLKRYKDGEYLAQVADIPLAAFGYGYTPEDAIRVAKEVLEDTFEFYWKFLPSYNHIDRSGQEGYYPIYVPGGYDD